MMVLHSYKCVAWMIEAECVGLPHVLNCQDVCSRFGLVSRLETMQGGGNENRRIFQGISNDFSGVHEFIEISHFAQPSQQLAIEKPANLNS